MGEELEGKKSKAPIHYRILSLLIALFLAGVSPSTGFAAEGSYPDRPINMIVPFAAGGGSDLGSKVVADKINEFLGQPLISVYKPGGGSALGTAYVAKAKPDGYTVLVESPNPLFLQAAMKKIDFKLDDFIHIGVYAKIPLWLVVKADSRWKTLQEFVEEEKKSPGKLKVGIHGKFTTADLVTQLLNKYAQIKLTIIPFKSAGESLTAVLGGHVDAATATGAGGLLESGSVRILALAGDRRLEDMPDIPTFKEFGYPLDFSIKYSFAFPKGTPKAIVDKFTQAQERASKRYSREIREGLRKIEMWPDFLSPQDTIKEFKKDQESIVEAVKELWKESQ